MKKRYREKALPRKSVTAEKHYRTKNVTLISALWIQGDLGARVYWEFGGSGSPDGLEGPAGTWGHLGIEGPESFEAPEGASYRNTPA